MMVRTNSNTNYSTYLLDSIPSQKMQLKHTLPLSFLSLLMGSVVGQSCYGNG